MKPIFVKYGGSLLDDASRQSLLLAELAKAAQAKLPMVLVHGGGKEISRQMERAGLVPNFVNGRRYTDEATMAVVEKALQELNASVVSELRKFGARARGFSGRYEHILEARAEASLGRVGMPHQVSAAALSQILSGADVPVFYSVAEDASRQALNVNADDFALELAVAAQASDLIFLTDTGGILDKAGRLIETLTPSQVEAAIADGTISGGMMVKARSCVDALRRGVQRVRIGKMLRHQAQELVVEAGTGFTGK